MTDAADDAVWFMGDLSDPWVVSIGEALARCAGIVQVHCPGDLGDRPFEAARPPRLIVIHRHRFTAVDAQRLKEYRVIPAGVEPPAVLLCISPYVRYEELERWSSLADRVVSEATAADILPRHVARLVEDRKAPSSRVEAGRFRIEVAGSSYELCQAVVEACAGAGYRTVQVPDLEDAGAMRSSARRTDRTLTIWDVPVLEPDWPQRLERRARATGPVITLFGFPDRETVTIAREAGAIACLDLPYSVDDLIDVIARAGRSVSPDRWPVSPRVEQPHRLPPPPRGRKQPQERPAAAVPWSDESGKPKVR